MNRTSLARRTQIINCLVEGNSIRSTERMTDTHRDTIMRLLVEVGSGCAKLMDEQMRELPCRRIQVDEIWAYVGKRTRVNAVAFMGDLSERLANRVQLSSDALSTYVDAVERAFGADVDYGQEVKFYDAEPIGPGRYSPPKVVSADRVVIAGDP